MQLEAAFAAALRVLAPPPPFAVAVSGGPDSMALMRLAAPLAPIVFTVDHGLRSGAAEEARMVAGAAASLGLTHETLVWKGDKPGAGIQAAAREARYRLLAEGCLRFGAASLLTGHTLDDQIETVAMRRSKGSGASGLAGMPSQTLLPGLAGGVRLVRPLIATRKAALVAMLEAEGQRFAVDPSNLDRRFDRGRLRRDGPVDVGVDEIVAAQRERIRVERAALAWLEAECVRREECLIVPRGTMTALPAEIADAVLVALLRRVGASDYPGTRPERARVMAALAKPDPFTGRTLAGVIVRPATRADLAGGGDWVVLLPETDLHALAGGWWLPFSQFPQLGIDGAALTVT